MTIRELNQMLSEIEDQDAEITSIGTCCGYGEKYTYVFHTGRAKYYICKCEIDEQQKEQ